MATSDNIEKCYLPLPNIDMDLMEVYQMRFDKKNFTWIEKMGLVISFSTYFIDVYSDVSLAISYYNTSEIAYCGLTLVFILSPAVTMSVFSYLEYRNYINFMHKQQFPQFDKTVWVFRKVCMFLLISPVTRYVEAWVYGSRYMKAKKNNDKKGMYENYVFMYVEMRTAMVFRLVESFIESAPQMTLQLCIMTASAMRPKTESSPMGFQLFSIVTSMFSLALTVTNFRSLFRELDANMDDDEEETSWLGKLVLLVAHIFEIIARVFVLSLFASKFGWIVFLVLSTHIGIALLTLYVLKAELTIKQVEHLNDQRKFSPAEQFCLNLIMAIVFVFTYIHNNGRIRYRFYMAACFVLNSFLVTLWWTCTGKDEQPLFHRFMFFTQFPCFVASILFYWLFQKYELQLNKIANELTKTIAENNVFTQLFGTNALDLIIRPS